MNRLLSKFIAALTLILGVMPMAPAMAAGASMSITSNYGTVSSGQSFVIAVYMNGGGTPINAVEADLSYPASSLQYVGLNYGGGVFSISTPGDGGGNGAISIQNGTTSSVSGSGLIATVTFRALTNSGTAYIGFSGTSSLISANTNSPVPFGAYGLTVHFGASSSSPHTSAAPAQPSAPAAPKDTTPPVISDVKIKDLSPFGANVTWTTNEPGSSEVDYGLDDSYGLSTASSTLTTTHSVALNSAFLTPETTFHYHVKSADASGNVATSPDQHFSLPGVPVKIVVLGTDGKPEADATVTLDGATSTTNNKGEVTLPSSLGNKKITTTFQGVTIQRPISVERTTKLLSPYQLDLSRQPLNGWMLTSIGLFVVVLALLGIDAVLFGSHFFRRLSGLHLSPAAAAVGNQRLHLPHFSSIHRDGLAPIAPAEPAASPEPPLPVSPPAEPPVAAVQAEPAPAKPAPTPVHVGFNIKTTGDHVIPPSLRAIDNIQPLSLRRNHTPVAPLAASSTLASDAANTEPTPVMPVVTKIAISDTPSPKKHRTRKASKKPKVAISSGPTDTPVSPASPTPEN